MIIKFLQSEVFKSLVFRMGGMAVGFITTAVLVRKMGAVGYGTWATLTSLLAWIQLSDFGVGYALKNRIAGSTRPQETGRLVAGVFQFYSVVALLIAIVFAIAGNMLTIVRDHPLPSMVLYLGTMIFFPLTIGAAVLQGLRKTSTSLFIGFLQTLFWMGCVLLLTGSYLSLVSLSLLNISIVLLMGIVQCVLGAKLLGGSLPRAVSALSAFKNIRLATPLWATGFRFIILQLTGAVLFSLGTYLTYSKLSAGEAAKFDILYKVFQIPMAFFNVLISVYWVEIRRLIALDDGAGLRKKFGELHLAALAAVTGTLIFAIFFAKQFVASYSGGRIVIEKSDALFFWLLIAVQIFAFCGAVYLNAAERLKGQIVLSVGAAVLLIPLVTLLFKAGAGFSAVPLATSILLVPSFLYCNYSAYRHVIQKAD